MDFDLFVIGGGSAGTFVARASPPAMAPALGSPRNGSGAGTCVNIGCVPKKLLVQAGEYGAWADDAAGFGWTIIKEKHDWPALIAAKDREITRLEGIYRRLLNNAGATIFDARATFIDPHTLDVGGKRVTAEKIVIATGGYPERPPIPGAELGIISDDAFYLRELPKKIIICGSGFIAVEFAGIFQALGAETHLVYRQPLPLRGFDQDMREGLAEALSAQGVILHPSCPLKKLEADGEKRILTFGDNQSLSADLVFFATGRKPNTAGLGLDKAGVAVNASGAVVVSSEAAVVAIPYLRSRRRHRSHQPDAGGHRRRPRSGRHAVREQSARDIVAQRSVRGVLHAPHQHRWPDRGRSRGKRSGRYLRREVHPHAAQSVGSQTQVDHETRR